MPVYSVRTLSSGGKPGGLTAFSVHSVEPMTVALLLAHLASQGSVLPPGSTSGAASESTGSYLILINGRSAHAMDGQDTLLADGDTVSILVPVSGG